jgi:glycosyltransferase involved in cell wall biosynthesis
MNYDIVCFSHLRWNFVYQRPQQLMSRLSTRHRVLFFEEPVFDAGSGNSRVEVRRESGAANVTIVVPHLPAGCNEQQTARIQARLLTDVIFRYGIQNYISWYYSPMALAFSDHLNPLFRVYDCMDELSAFLFAPPALKTYEEALLKTADIVFTGGRSLYLAKKRSHPNIYAFPSSIDKNHFHAARTSLPEPADQRLIPHPRIGFYGVIDERMDLGFLDAVSVARPDWHYVLAGPVVKIDPATLPRRDNIHYPGSRVYDELPAWLSGWDIAMMPFALNASTRFISPTKTPEYLAGGKPVIAPSIADVVDPYGEGGLVAIADTPEAFIAVAEEILTHGVPAGWLKKVDAFLANTSWDTTVAEMEALIEKGAAKNALPAPSKKKSYV